MMKRILACALCLMLLLSVLPTAAAAELQTVRIEDVGVTLRMPSDFDCLTLDLPAEHTLWTHFDRTEFMQEYEEYGTFLNAFHRNGLIILAHVSDSWMPDFDLVSEDVIVQEFREVCVQEDETVTVDPHVVRTDDGVYFSYSYQWSSDNGTVNYTTRYLTSRNATVYDFYFVDTSPFTQVQEQQIHDILFGLTIDRDAPQTDKTHSVTVQNPGISMEFPASYTCQQYGGTQVRLYAGDGCSEMELHVQDSYCSWDGYSDGAMLFEGKDAMQPIPYDELYSPVAVYDHDQVPFLSVLYLDTAGRYFRHYFTHYHGRQYDIIFFTDEPITTAMDAEYRSIVDHLQFLPSAQQAPSESDGTDHVVSLADEPTTDLATGVSFLLPDRWRYSASKQVQSAYSFSLDPQWIYSSDYAEEIVAIYCSRFPQSDVPHLDGLTDPKEIAAAVISRNQDETVTPDMLEWRNFKGNEYYIYRPTVPGFLNYTDLMVHVRDGQVYLFATDVPLDSPMHKDFMAMMGTVEFGPFTVSEERNEAEPVEAPPELPKIDTDVLRTILLWAVGILLAVLVGLILFLLLVVRKPKPKPTPTGHFCPYCGKALEDDTQFCPHCGKQL